MDVEKAKAIQVLNAILKEPVIDEEIAIISAKIHKRYCEDRHGNCIDRRRECYGSPICPFSQVGNCTVGAPSEWDTEAIKERSSVIRNRKVWEVS